MNTFFHTFTFFCTNLTQISSKICKRYRKCWFSWQNNICIFAEVKMEGEIPTPKKINCLFHEQGGGGGEGVSTLYVTVTVTIIGSSLHTHTHTAYNFVIRSWVGLGQCHFRLGNSCRSFFSSFFPELFFSNAISTLNENFKRKCKTNFFLNLFFKFSWYLSFNEYYGTLEPFKAFNNAFLLW